MNYISCLMLTIGLLSLTFSILEVIAVVTDILALRRR